MKGAEFLTKALEREGVELIFGYPGGAIMPVYDALLDSKIRHILVRHEQAAALAADGYARATGKVGVCMSTSGPGATNLVTGIANAYMDSVPVVAITGQVPTHLMGTDAFQEVDIFGITLPVVKHSFLVEQAEELGEVVHEAFRIAGTGRPGPVLIDLPKDIGNAVADFRFAETKDGECAPPPPAKEVIARAAEMLRQSRRPVIYAGGGIGMGRAVEEFRKFVTRTGIPVVSTLKGLGALPADHESFLGMMGMHGNKAANDAVQSCDLLICIGARFDDRATGRLAAFAPEAKVIHLDVDPSEIGKLRHADVGIAGDLRPALEALSFALEIEEWRKECRAGKAAHAWTYERTTQDVYAPWFLKRLSDMADENTIVTCDVGQHQMWVAQHWSFSKPENHLSSGGLGTMGFGLPAAIGAQFGRPDARVINVTGDGSIMMNLQELATLRRYDLPVKIVLFDNQALGMVRQWQELFHERRYSEVDLSDNPDFTEVAKSMGIPAFRVEDKDEVEPAIERLLAESGPVLAHVLIHPMANVWPIVGPGRSNSEMMEEKVG
jgi:acetolactate synthase-1/2/3 large subunit